MMLTARGANIKNKDLEVYFENHGRESTRYYLIDRKTERDGTAFSVP